MKTIRILLLAGLALLLAALAGVGRPEAARGLAQDAPRELTASGTGAVQAVPDVADLSFGVVSQAATARAALAANASAAARVIEALKDAGIASRDLQTEQVSLAPRTTERGDEIVGYTAANTVRATLRDLDRAGAVIDTAVAAGANSVFGPSLARSNRAQLYREALRGAVADARVSAQAIAAAAGVTLGPVTRIVETGSAPPPVAAATDVGRAASAPIEPGTQRIEATVSVTFALS